MNISARVAAAAVLATAALAAPAAAAVKIDFEGVPNLHYVSNHYNGGISQDATFTNPGVAGANLGVAMTGSPLVLIRTDVCTGICFLSGYFPTAPSGSSALINITQRTGDIAISFIDLAAGFTGSASVWHWGGPAYFGVYANLGGRDGNNYNPTSLGGMALPQSAACPDVLAVATTCSWTKYTLSFTGTARSIELAGPAAYFDDVMLGAPGVPEPASWAMMILGLGGIGAVQRIRARRAQMRPA